MKRYALVYLGRTTAESVARYLPSNYSIIGYVPMDPDSKHDLRRLGACVLIEGRDNSGWTLDDYVIPRLGSGLITAHEVSPAESYVQDMVGAIWNNNELQFARLLAEIMATQVSLDFAALCESMDLSMDELYELFDRAQKIFDGAKELV